MIDTAILNNPGKNAAILMRHADRERIKIGVNEAEPLNAKGIANSIEIGKKLRQYGSIKIFSSPIGRCVQTGEAILQGAEKDGIVLQSNVLGEPGPFVVDRTLAGKAFKELNTYRVVGNLMDGVEIAGIRPSVEGCELLKNFIVSEMNMSVDGDLLIFITHDSIVVPFVHRYTGEKFDKEHWIGFADGAIIVKEEENLWMVRNGERHAMR